MLLINELGKALLHPRKQWSRQWNYL